MKQASLCSSIVQGGGKRNGANPSSSAFASFRSSVSKPSVNQPYTDASSSRACCATSPSGASGPRRQPVTLIPDRDGVAAVLRLPSRQQRSPPTPMLSGAPVRVPPRLGFLTRRPFIAPIATEWCPFAATIGPEHPNVHCKGESLTMLTHSSKFRTMRTFGKALRCRNAHCSPNTRRPKAPTKI